MSEGFLQPAGRPTVVFDSYGVTVRLWGGRYFIDFDGGGHQVHPMAYEISAEEAELTRRSERDAYLVIVGCEKGERRLVTGAAFEALTAG